ncbi:CHAT domain-containing protein [Floridanema aerugineum]|uniref:Tetratricopeptide repeat protein n=1 Tax=Floridaenema aerugineum BLCC-F46 TaxID=3153654 RepID=A0ABV4XGK4_9CYAN
MFLNFTYLSLLTAILTLSLNAPVLDLRTKSELLGITSQNSEPKQSPSTKECKTEAEQLLQQSAQLWQNNKYHEALESYQRVLAICQKLSDRKGIRDTTYEIGLVYVRLSNYTQALQFFEQSLIISKELGDKKSLGKTFAEIAMIYYYQGQYYQALKFGQQALAVDQEIGNKAGIGHNLNRIGLFYEGLSNYPQALKFYQQSLAIGQEIDDKVLLGRTLNNIGMLYTAIGESAKALDFYQRALVFRRETKNLMGEAKTLHNIGWAYEQLSNYSKALEFYQQALAISRRIGNRASTARTLNNIGTVYQKQEQYIQALEVLNPALVIFQELGENSWIGNTLETIGNVYKGLNQFPQALDSYQKALAIIREVGDRRIERLILSNIGEVLVKENQLEMAIVFYKLSVNVTESIRQELRSLPISQQRSYTTTVADTYRRLADLLLQQDRVLEAQQVLDLLKVQELEDYLQNVRGTQQTAQGIPLNPQERQINDKYNQILNQEIQLGRELAELQKIPLADRTPEQQQRIAQLNQIQQEINGKFLQFINSPEIITLVQQLSPSTREQNISLNQLNTIRADILRQLQPKAVLLYPLILENRLELVLVAPDAPPIHRSVNVKKADLNRAIVEFRMALENPKSDAKAPALKLYNWLIKPIEKDLKQAEAKSIIYAPDGQLRYISLAALYDGEQWLVQRFVTNNITAMSLTKFIRQRRAQPQVMAGAFATGRYNFKMEGTPLAFDGLKFAGVEVENIAAIMPGTIKLLDREFSREGTIPRLNDFSIVHLATHAMFVTGKPEDSFIVLGDGSLFTLRDIQLLSLPNVDLVVLSACQTGIGGKLGNGEEILGFGYQVQQTGAKAAIASLWKVNDGGTQALMTAFYAALQSDNNSLALALQKAQIALITGNDITLSKSQYQTVQQRTRSNLPSAVANALSHPHYWAPFILIGNGL